jgi:hypothetical protein
MTSCLFLRGFSKNSWVRITSCLAGAATSEGACRHYTLCHDNLHESNEKKRSFDPSMTCISIFFL